MKIRKIAAFFLISFSLASHNATAESSVWKISKGENYFYIGGTIHILSENDHPLPDEFNKAYKDSSKIVFETDLVATQSPEFQSKFIAAMTYSDNRNLSSELEPNVFRKLEDFMSTRQIPIENFSKFKPWGVSLIISVLEYQRLGMIPEYGVDAYFNKLALTDNKTVIALETPEEQIIFLKSMENIDPNEGINYTLKDLEHLPEFIDMMKNSWRNGDIEAFSKSSSVIQMKIDFPAMYDTIVTNRNNEWMKHVPSFINDSNIEFLLVGSLHLNGKKGLLNQLKTQGFTVEQL